MLDKMVFDALCTCHENSRSVLAAILSWCTSAGVGGLPTRCPFCHPEKYHPAISTELLSNNPRGIFPGQNDACESGDWSFPGAFLARNLEPFRVCLLARRRCCEGKAEPARSIGERPVACRAQVRRNRRAHTPSHGDSVSNPKLLVPIMVRVLMFYQIDNTAAFG